MILTKQELIGLFRHEVHVLLHLAGKIDQSQLDYRPTPKQRSTRELLQYLSFMGPTMIEAGVKDGKFDPAKWTAAENAAKAKSFDQILSAIRAQSETYTQALDALSDADFRREINMFGQPQSLGVFLVSSVLAGYVAYRTQLFLYLKACGRTELNTMNLWAGVDAPMTPA
jgi:hypothetical protein